LGIDVCFWHKVDMPTSWMNVRSQEPPRLVRFRKGPRLARTYCWLRPNYNPNGKPEGSRRR